MLFNSWVFALFLPVVFTLHWLRVGRRQTWQNVVLLIASYVFYGYWDYRFLSLIFLSSLVDYLVGIGLATSRVGWQRKLFLGTSLATNLGILGFFKYFGFFVESFTALLGTIGLHPSVWTLHVILPVGISFYTFQTLGYSIDVYRGHVTPTRDPLAFFTYVSFFPQLVAGPIERAAHLLPQFQTKRAFDTDAAKDGIRQMLWGFFKKLVVADNLAPHVDWIFANHGGVGAGTLALGLIMFSFQIYGDFSGYSDIAVGTGRLFGVRLMRNFANPYFAENIAVFWRRWHISLSTWFRDYVYLPLGGGRVGSARHALNVLITFVVSGLWHGANWTFVVWGLLHGLYYLPNVVRRRLQPSHTASAPTSWGTVVHIVITFSLTTLAWTFFRAASIGDAANYLGRLMTLQRGVTPLEDPAAVGAVLGYIIVLLGVEWLTRDREHGLDVKNVPQAVRWLCYLAIALAVAFLGNFGELTFIYFQF